MDSHQPSSYRRPHNGDESFENGERVPVSDFDFSAVEVESGDGDVDNRESIRRAMQESMIRTLQFVCAGDANAHEAGRRAIIRLHLLRPQGTQAELAAKLGITAGRLSQILNIEKQKFAQCFQHDSAFDENLN